MSKHDQYPPNPPGPPEPTTAPESLEQAQLQMFKISDLQQIRMKQRQTGSKPHADKPGSTGFTTIEAILDHCSRLQVLTKLQDMLNRCEAQLAEEKALNKKRQISKIKQAVQQVMHLMVYLYDTKHELTEASKHAP